MLSILHFIGLFIMAMPIFAGGLFFLAKNIKEWLLFILGAAIILTVIYWSSHFGILLMFLK